MIYCHLVCRFQHATFSILKPGRLGYHQQVDRRANFFNETCNPMNAKPHLTKIILGHFSLLLLLGTAQAVDLDLARFATAKKAQARELAAHQTNKVPAMVWSFFDAVQAEDWETSTNLTRQIQEASGRYEKKAGTGDSLSAVWPPISDTIGANIQFHDWDAKWLHRYGNDIINSIPNGSVYFGGTDPGRYIVSALVESQIEGRPFFVLTQNQLADGQYLAYLKSMYGKKIYIPNEKDFADVFSLYTTDAAERYKTGHLKPGEDVKYVGGKMQVSGQTAVMAVNGLLAKIILEKNPDRQFFIEESFPLDWMYPYLTPHGLIMELHHDPLKEISGAVLAKDHDYWKSLMGEIAGDWINEKTSTQEICDFADKIHVRKDFTDFKGDAAFAKNSEEEKAFSKLRTSLAALYVWRARQAKDESERKQLRAAAELAFKQALACYPSMPETVYQYATLMYELHRIDEAILVTKTAMRADPDSKMFDGLLKWLEQSN
jgi:hypothetical protein